MRVRARLTSYESWKTACYRFALCSSRLSKIVQSGLVNKRSQQNLIFTSFENVKFKINYKLCLSDRVTCRIVNSHQLSPRLTGT